MRRLSFIVMVGLWGAFIALAFTSPETLDEIWRWAGDLWWPVEIAVWILFLPWMIGLLRLAGGLVVRRAHGRHRGARAGLVGRVVPAQVAWTAAAATSGRSPSRCSP